ncbi:MAG: hypothetical protein ACE5KE_01920 [Methanosarcinales archaeon]
MDVNFPRGTFKYYLSLEDNSIRNILSELKKQNFDGCLHIAIEIDKDFHDGDIILKNGDVFATIYENLVGNEALSKLIDQSENNNGAIDVYQYNIPKLEFAIEIATELKALVTKEKIKKIKEGVAIHNKIKKKEHVVAKDASEIISKPSKKNISFISDNLPEIEHKVIVDNKTELRKGVIGFIQIVKNHSDFIANIDLEIEYGNNKKCYSVILAPNTTNKFRYETSVQSIEKEAIFRILLNGVQLDEKKILISEYKDNSQKEKDDIITRSKIAQEVAKEVGIDFIKKVRKMHKLRTYRK